METLSTTSTPLTTFIVTKPTKPHHLNHLNHLKPPSHHHHHHHTTTTTTTTLSTLHQKDHFTPTLNFHHPSPPQPLKPPSTTTHHRSAASGYAAALLDVAQRNGTVLRVVKDVRRLINVLGRDHVMEFMVDNSVDDVEKRNAVKELLDKGKFEMSFVVLVKLIVDKGKKISFVNDVLGEFLRVFNQLSYGNNYSVSQNQKTRLSLMNYA